MAQTSHPERMGKFIRLKPAGRGQSWLMTQQRIFQVNQGSIPETEHEKRLPHPKKGGRHANPSLMARGGSVKISTGYDGRDRETDGGQILE